MDDRGEGVMDLEALMARLGGDRELLGELVTIYFEDEAGQIGQVESAVAAADAESVWRAAHAVKGSVANFSAGRAQAAALALELAGRNKDLSNAAALLDTLRRELTALREALGNLAASH